MSKALITRLIDPARYLPEAQWLDLLEDIAEEHGYFEPLGPDHSAMFLDNYPVLLVTFETMESIRARTHSDVPLGWDMAAENNWSQLCLMSHGETLFRHRAVYQFFDGLVDDGFFDGFDRVVFYGAETCGYAAAAYSVVAPGAMVLAISPQATLDPRLTEWDDRFHHMRRTNFTDRYGYAPDMLDAARQAFVPYDPEVEADAMHAALFNRKNVARIRCRHMSDQIETFFRQMELLMPLLTKAIGGDLNVADFHAALRERKNYLPYLRKLLAAVRISERPYLTAMMCRSVLRRMNVPQFRQQLSASTKELGGLGNHCPHRHGWKWLSINLYGDYCAYCVIPAPMTRKLTIRRPDDWHLHLRDGAMLRAVLPETARHFARAIIMPNLAPPVLSGADAAAYRTRILAALPAGMTFEPLMTLYLTETTDVDDLTRSAQSGLITAVKLYPAGATTNSAEGVRDFDKVRPVLERMAEIGLPLCVHGEVSDPEIDIFDREAVFIDRVLDPIRRATPQLRVVLEHVTTKDGVDYISAADRNLGATITAHHLMINRNHILAGAIRPHYYCLPVAKRESHRLALLRAATSGDARFFLGTDSAPHLDALKEAACGCAGCFTASNAMSILAHVFEQEAALDRLEDFTSRRGAEFYRLPLNQDTLTLTKGKPFEFPVHIQTGDGPLTVFDPGAILQWQVKS